MVDMSRAGTKSARSAEIREKLDHPIVDADGHMLEITPVFVDYIRDTMGESIATRYLSSAPVRRYLEPWNFTDEERRERWVQRSNLWGVPTKNTLDRATAILPRLYAERMDDLGIDYSILYPSEGLFVATIEDDEVRNLACRAYNGFVAELCGPYADRMTPVGTIPMNSPEEAIRHLEYAVGEQGIKVVCMTGYAHRPIGDAAKKLPEQAQVATRLDYFGLDSDADYDPVWAKCVELGVAATFHSASGLRAGRSISNYVYNHIGSIAQAQEGLAKALFLGGVTRRFPTLNFGFLECGATWACSLYSELVGHWEKRNLKAMAYVDPANLDRERLLQYIEEYGDARTKGSFDKVREFFHREYAPLPEKDDFHECGIESAQDVERLFIPRFYIGCEADDRSVAWAFNTRVNPFGAKVRAMFGSDVGHWDVVDVGKVVEEAYELVEHELITKQDFKEFAFSNPVELHAGMNPDFFKGTRVEASVAEFMRQGRPS